MLLNIIPATIGIFIGTLLCKSIDKYIEKKKQNKNMINKGETNTENKEECPYEIETPYENIGVDVPIPNDSESDNKENETKNSTVENENEKLISALRTIKTTCEMAYDCPECPLRMAEDDCNFVLQPKDWNINEEFDGNDKAIK